MVLSIDIGNTNIKFGMFVGNELISSWRIATDRKRLADEYAMVLFNLLASSNLTHEIIAGCVISSVVPVLTQEFSELSRRYLDIEPVVIGPDVETGMVINTDYPAEVGPDLIVNAVAARFLYGAPVIVIGFGTATTFTVVSAEGNFEGVAIAPGVETGADALFQFAARLPQVELAAPRFATGKNTIQAIQSGLVYGYAGLVEGLVHRLRAECENNARVIATGGLAKLISPQTHVIEIVESNLTLIGLNLIYRVNRST